jgi:hypothetical protein
MANYSGGNLYIVDEEYYEAGRRLSQRKEFLKDAVSVYIQIADYICDNQQGKYVDKLKALVADLKPYPGKIEDACGYHQWDCTQYVDEIDSADQFLFD